MMSHHQNWFIVIRTVGRTDLLGRTLRSLVTAGVARFPVEIVVVENGGTRRAAELVKSLAEGCRIQYLAIPEVGQAAASNAFLNRNPGTFAWFLDDDVRVTAEAIEAYHLAAQRGQQGREYYGGPLGIDYETPPPEWLLTYLPRSARGWQPNMEDVATTVPMFLGANWAAWADDLLAVGGFENQFGPGGVGAETALQKKLLQRGMRPVYLPQGLVYHWVPRSRCSPQWVLRRAYQIGVAEGLEQPGSEVFLFGYPRWAYRGLMERFSRWCVTRFSRDVHRRFQAAYELWFFLGWMKGKQARRYRPT
ncbi:MAG TPA: glycosyltransferase [Thermogutta sp.]|nr:glycosyltransferase [Thermogutta sp.]